MLLSIPDDHVAGFHYMDDVRDIWNAVKARFGGNAKSKRMRKSMLKQEFLDFRIGEAEGLHKRYDRMQKILSQLNQLKAKPEDEDINLKFLRALPSSCRSARPSHSAFVSATSASKNMSYGDSLSYSSTTTYSVPSNSKTGAKGGNDKQRYSSFKIKEIGKKEEDLKALITVDTLVDWTDHDGESDGVIASKEFGMIAGCDTKDAIEEGAAKIYNLITEADTEEASTTGDAGEFALMGVTSEVHNCPFSCDNKYNELHKQYNELNEQNGEYFIQVQAYKNSLKTLEKQKRVLQRKQLTLEDKIKMSYGTKSSTSCDSKFVSNDFVSYDDSDKSSEVNTNEFSSSDSNVKSLEPKPNNYTSCTSTCSVSISKNETEIESNVRTPIQEPIIVQDLPSFSCNSSDKNENTSRTSCNKNGYFNKKAGHFRKHASSVSKLRFVCGSGTHLIKDCDFYEKQIANKTVGIGVGPVHCRNKENPFSDAEVEGIFDSGCSRSMTGNKERLDDFQVIQGGKVTFGGGECKITGKGTIRTLTLDFKNVYYVKELQQFSLFSISQICDKKNRVLFTNNEYLVLSKDFTLPNESMVVLRVPRKHNLYFINLNNLCPRGNLACLVAHATVDEYVKWYRRMGHVNYKNMNILVKGNLVRGLPPKLFKDDHTCVACCKGKQHKASYKAINATKAVRTTCYVLNRVLVTSPRNKTPYALLTGNIPFVSHFRPFGCYVTILNTSDHLGKFNWKADEGYIIGYSTSNKAYRVYNVPNKRVEESMNLRFLEEKPNVQGLGHEWYFNLDYLTDTLGYKHVQANQSTGTQGAATNPADTSGDDVDDSPLNSADKIFQKELARLKGQEHRATSDAESLGLGFANNAEELRTQASAKTVPTGCIPVPTGSIPVPASDIVVSTDDVPIPSSRPTASFFNDEPTTRFPCPSDLGNHDPLPGIFSSSSYDDESGNALSNVASTVEISPVATRQINTIYPQSLIIRDPTSVVQMRSKFKFQNVWVLVDLPAGKYAIGTKWILKNKKDAKGIVVRNKSRLVAQGHRQEEGIDYNEVFAPVARIEAIRLFLAVASYMGFMVYQMDVKSAFLYERIDEEAQLTRLYFLRRTTEISSGYKFMWMTSSLDLQRRPGLQVQQRPDGIFINQEKYVQEILNKFDLRSVRTATTPYEAPKPKSKNESDSPVNVHLYISMIGSLMYLTASRPDIMFAVSACSRNQVIPITSNLEAVKKIFRLISWQCKKQTIMATSSTEAEYVAIANCCGQLRSADDGGIDDLPIAEIYSGMDNLGPIAVAFIYLSDGRRFNWSSYIFKGMVSNIGNAKKFLMYPRFLQAILDQNTASFSRSHETDVGPFTNMEDEPLEGSFHMSPPRSTQAPLVDQPSGSVEDPITLTALSSVVSTLVQKVNSLETELKDHKKLFKDVVGKLVKKVKAIEVKLKTTKRKMVVSDSDQKDGEKQDVDLDALHALANAAVTVDSNIPPGGASHIPAASTSVLAAVPTGASTVPVGSPSVLADVPHSVAPAGVSNKGKSLMVEEDIPVKEKTFKQMQEDILRAGFKEADWINIMAQVEVNASLSKTLLGDDVSEDNFLARMAALIKRKKQALAEKLAKERQDRPMTQAQQRTYMRQFVKNQSCAVYSTEAPIPSSLGRTRLTNPKSKLQELDLDADDQTFITVVSDEDSEDKAPRLWYALVGWEVVYMFIDVPYPLFVKLIELMLKHKLEIDKDVVGNDMTTAEQLIQFIKNQLAAAQVSPAWVFNSPMLYLLRVKMAINLPWIMSILGTKELASPEQTAPVKHDVIVMDRNAIALFRLAIRSSPGRNDGTARLESRGETQLVAAVKLQKIDKHFVEQMVVRELLEADIVGNEKVLHKIMNVVERDNIVEQLVITVIDSEYDCTKFDDLVDRKDCSDR
uniref:Ribonuclease H-like domain-containing protein n=1 Tax=Tanacetum cinerariifolium TaxID=118510 RepID=A0A6L2KTI3_TANCI|nr:ribonuclease H-like domain-containing protein [Tanacetum cinerariifolium]